MGLLNIGPTCASTGVEYSLRDASTDVVHLAVTREKLFLS